MNQIKILAAVCLAAGSLVSCSQDDDIALGSKLIGNDAVTIVSFPTYNIESNSRASSIGTTDAGKTAWADGDVVYLEVSVSGKSTIYNLTYRNGSWVVPTIVISPDSYSDKVTYTAYYAPNYELKSDGTLGLKDRKTVGTAEYLKYESSDINYLDFTGFNIAFSRNYSRLRVACDDSLDVSFSFTGFTPVDGKAAENYTITPDENGNAYLYGSWAAGSKIEFGESPVDGIVYGYKISTASSEGKSYAIRSNTATIYLNELGSFDNACTALKSFASKYGLSNNVNTPLVNFKVVGEHSYFYGSVDGTENSIFPIVKCENSVKTLDVTNVNMTEVCSYEFYGYENVTAIYLPNDGEEFSSIGQSAFKDCKILKKIDIPESVTSIGALAFYGCKEITQFVIPNNVKTIGNSAFYNCIGLTQFVIPDNVTSIGTSVFKNCSSLTSIQLSSKLKIIPESAFESCSKITEISIPSSITSIGKSAFYGCSGLIKVVCNVTTPIDISSVSNVFPTSSSSRYLYVPSESVSKYSSPYSSTNKGWTKYFDTSNIKKIE
jgi:hypothetical protein